MFSLWNLNLVEIRNCNLPSDAIPSKFLEHIFSHLTRAAIPPFLEFEFQMPAFN